MFRCSFIPLFLRLRAVDDDGVDVSSTVALALGMEERRAISVYCNCIELTFDAKILRAYTWGSEVHLLVAFFLDGRMETIGFMDF